MARGKLAVHLREKPVIDFRLDQRVAEAAQRRAVRYGIIHAKASKTAEGKAVVNLFLYFPVAQAIPHAHEFHAEQNHAVVTRTACSGKTFAKARLYQRTKGMPVYHGVYLVEKLGFHLAPLQLQVTETQLGSS